jgi:small subunit ribosomal protein S9e
LCVILVFSEAEQKLDNVLGLTVEKFLDRRLESIVEKQHMATSIHHARCIIKQRHIRVGKNLVDIPSFMVRVDSEKHIKFRATSPFSLSGAKPGRVARKHKAAKGEEEQ